jgi:hypothetical protein
MCCTRLLSAYASQVFSTFDITGKNFTYIPITDTTHLKESISYSQNLYDLIKNVTQEPSKFLQKLIHINTYNTVTRNGMEKYSSLFNYTLHILASKHGGN